MPPLRAPPARFALLDVTGIEQIDAETAAHLLQIAGAVQLLGARSLVTGIQPAVAQAMRLAASASAR